MKVERRNYSKEFKLDAISLVEEQSYTRSEAARSLGIHPSLLGRWLREYREGNTETSFRGKGNSTPEQKEIKRLKSQVKKLEMEKDILKKATVFFAAQTK